MPKPDKETRPTLPTPAARPSGAPTPAPTGAKITARRVADWAGRLATLTPVQRREQK